MTNLVSADRAGLRYAEKVALDAVMTQLDDAETQWLELHMRFERNDQEQS